jgi:hypothetical protein
VQSLTNEHLEGKQNRRLLNLEKWCEKFLA